MKVNCAHTELIDTDLLVPNPKNPNKHPDRQIKFLAKIMAHQGWRHPITVSNQSGFVVAGHGRLAAARLNGWEKCPVDKQNFATPADEFAHMIADNKIAELAEHDDALMIEELKGFPELDLELLGIPDLEMPEEPEPLKDEIEDDVPENVETRCKRGQMWILGEHKLLCGDSTDKEHVDKLMGDEKADMVFTDPPYGMKLDTDYSKTMNVGGKSKISNTHFAQKHKKVQGDDLEFDPSFLLTTFEYCKEIFLWGFDYYAYRLPAGTPIVWDKRGSESMDKGYGSVFELCWSKNKHKREIARIIWTGFLGVKDDSKKRIHPTQKPTQLVEWFFDKWGKDKNNIIDLYGGSGSTLIACEKTNRKCFIMEIDPHYCDVIIERWEKYSGKEARLGTT